MFSKCEVEVCGAAYLENLEFGAQVHVVVPRWQKTRVEAKSGFELGKVTSEATVELKYLGKAVWSFGGDAV